MLASAAVNGSSGGGGGSSSSGSGSTAMTTNTGKRPRRQRSCSDAAASGGGMSSPAMAPVVQPQRRRRRSPPPFPLPGPSPLVVALLLLVFFGGFDVAHSQEKDAFEDEAFVDLRRGHELCPCLSAWKIQNTLPPWSDEAVAKLEADGLDPLTYGIGCDFHDAKSRKCSNSDDESCQLEESSTVSPMIPGMCDKSFCQKKFCYVDPDNCQLLYRPSKRIDSDASRYYSYGTCGDVDSFVSNQRIEAVRNKLYKVGLNSNSGGWQGAYSENPADPNSQFKGPFHTWTGPVVEFAFQAALRGGFSMNATVPPAFLRRKASEHFQSNSTFDYCVYATSLGYLDFCLAQYTITDLRASTTKWLVLGSQDLYLVGMFDERMGGWEKFKFNTGLIFKPFTPSVWFFMIFFVIPTLGCLMIVHEFNHPGSAYPAKTETMVSSNSTAKSDSKKGRYGMSKQTSQRGCVIERQRVPMYQHVARATYVALLSVLQQAYDHTVVTYGALINLLGISFFILTIVAVYTANLAAILTQKVQQTSIGGLEDALKANYRICSERKNLESIQKLYPNIHPRQLAVDPVDGEPGFNCPECSARRRVFDFLDPNLAATNPEYCHAAFAPLEDLETMNQLGFHCNKTAIGPHISAVQTGIPISEKVSSELITYFLKAKNEGLFDRQIIQSRPTSTCPDTSSKGEEGESLGISQLTGIWIVSFGFAFVGLVITFVTPRIDQHRKKSVRHVHQFNQRGECVNVLERNDKWIYEQSVVKNDGVRVYVGNSRWGRAMAAKEVGATMARECFHSGKRHLSCEFDDDLPRRTLKDLANVAVAANRIKRSIRSIESSVSDRNLITSEKGDDNESSCEVTSNRDYDELFTSDEAGDDDGDEDSNHIRVPLSTISSRQTSYGDETSDADAGEERATASGDNRLFPDMEETTECAMNREHGLLEGTPHQSSGDEDEDEEQAIGTSGEALLPERLQKPSTSIDGGEVCC